MGADIMHIEIGVHHKKEPYSKLYTTDLANILESKYGLFSRFSEMYRGDISEALADSLADATEQIFTIRGLFGKKPDPYAQGLKTIENLFKEYIDNEWLAGMSNGVPTFDALHGFSRASNRYSNVRRPSFKDTSTLRNNIKVTLVQDE